MSTNPDQTFSDSIPNNGGVALCDNLGNLIDQVGFSLGSAFKEGTPLSPLVGNTDQSYERRLGGPLGSCAILATISLISSLDCRVTHRIWLAHSLSAL